MLPVDDIRKSTEELLSQADKGKEDAEARKLKTLEEAGKIMEFKNSEAGKIFMDKLDEFRKGFEFKPQQMMKVSVFAPDGTPQSFEVDTTMVARLAGASEALEGIKNWIEGCERAIIKAAEKNK
jgi:hypothetical protein